MTRGAERACGARVQRVQKVQRVQRVVVAADAADLKKGARLRRRLCRKVASLPLREGSACGAEGGGLPLCGNAYKVSVTGLAFYVIWHDKHSADWLAALASPYPASPDFPLFRGQNKTPRGLPS